MARVAQNETNLWQSYKRQSIQEAVIRLMCREGLQSVTMERVAQEVGIAKGTVYLHYRDKQELLESVKVTSLEPLMTKVREICRGKAAPDRKLEAFALRYLSYFDEKRDLFRILLYEREVTRVHGSRYQSDRYRNLLRDVTGVIKEGIDAGVFREGEPDHIAAMFVEAVIALVNQRLLTEHPVPVEDDARLVYDIFLGGLRVRARRRSSK